MSSRLICGLLLLTLGVGSPALSQDTRIGWVRVSSMRREFGETFYSLRLKTSSGAYHSVEASKSGAPCETFVAGDEDVSATYTASTITLTSGKNVCRLTIQRMD
jgi:hypothetical protein